MHVTHEGHPTAVCGGLAPPPVLVPQYPPRRWVQRQKGYGRERHVHVGVRVLLLLLARLLAAAVLGWAPRGHEEREAVPPAVALDQAYPDLRGHLVAHTIQL